LELEFDFVAEGQRPTLIRTWKIRRTTTCWAINQAIRYVMRQFLKERSDLFVSKET